MTCPYLKIMRMTIEMKMMEIEMMMMEIEVEMFGVVPLFACFSSFKFLGLFDEV